MPVLEALDHEGRRQHHEPHILVRIDAARRHPEPELVVVGRERKGHAKGQRLAPRLAPDGDDARQRQGGCHRIEPVAVDFAHNRRMKLRRHRDRIAVDAEIEGRCDRHLDMAEAEAR